MTAPTSPKPTMPAECSVEGCERQGYGNGLCKMHWQRKARTGTTGEAGTRRGTYQRSETGICSLDGCARPHGKHGYCHMHAQRRIDTGNVGPVETIAPPPLPTCAEPGCDKKLGSRERTWCFEHGLVVKFWERVEITGACWLWRGTVINDYGRVAVGKRLIKAHRRAYELLVGPVPAGLVLDHLCAIKHCVNPDHLEPVTQGENARRGNTRQRHSTYRPNVEPHRTTHKPIDPREAA